MKTPADYLDAIREKHGLNSDRQAAALIGVTSMSVSRFRKGTDVFSDETAMKVAELLDLDPLEVVVTAHAARAKTNDGRELWTRALTRLHARRGDPMCIMSTSTRRRVAPPAHYQQTKLAGVSRPFC